MKFVVASLTVPDLAAAVAQPGAPHPSLGPLLHGGTYGWVEGATAAEILAAASGIEEVSVGEDAGPDLAALGERAALCVIATAGAASRPLAVFYGRGLPALGPISPCTLSDLRATWIAAAGGMPKAGRQLLQEQPEAWDPELERKLTQRLRQLYGE